MQIGSERQLSFIGWAERELHRPAGAVSGRRVTPARVAEASGYDDAFEALLPRFPSRRHFLETIALQANAEMPQEGELAAAKDGPDEEAVLDRADDRRVQELRRRVAASDRMLGGCGSGEERAKAGAPGWAGLAAPAAQVPGRRAAPPARRWPSPQIALVAASSALPVRIPGRRRPNRWGSARR